MNILIFIKNIILLKKILTYREDINNKFIIIILKVNLLKYSIMKNKNRNNLKKKKLYIIL